MRALLGTWWVLALPAIAAAHGAPASVLSVVRSDARGRPQLLRLSEGMAVRSGDRYRYVCPALFDVDDTPRAVALPSGISLVASTESVYLLDDDGRVSEHPDPAARELPLRALDSTADVAVGLRSKIPATETLELVQLDEQVVRVIAQVPSHLSSLAAEGDSLLVTGLTVDGQAQQRGFDRDGAELQEWSRQAPAPPDAVAALARMAGGQPYVLVLAGDGPISELVQLDTADGYRLLQRASVTLSGPVSVDADHVFVAFDGRLGTLADGVVTALPTEAPVTCVLRAGEHAFACVGTELRRLQASGVGERVFGLDQLDPPTLEELAPSVAERCNLQWLRFRVDLVGAGITPSDGARDGGASDGGMQDAGAADDGGAADGGARPRDDGGGCSTRHGAAAAGARAPWALVLAACGWAWTRARRFRKVRR